MVNRLLLNAGQREKFDFYVNYSIGKVLWDRGPEDDLFDFMFCHSSIYAETLESWGTIARKSLHISAPYDFE